ncbi:MAG: PqqD family peptide modification chaperone [Deltaproteobacteria bacterium]|nr:PqqD family peptide modification chaperone [Deltaproteobacteria bacterium]MBF0526213.1 PqqD family peptide modification chaperone [Deltaproteobacteria bacterium]
MTDVITTPRPKPMIVLREEFDDWALLFNPDTGKAVGLPPTGVTIWKSLTTGQDYAGVAAAVSAEYEPLPEDLDKDISAFFEDLVRLGYAEYTA